MDYDPSQNHFYPQQQQLDYQQQQQQQQQLDCQQQQQQQDYQQQQQGYQQQQQYQQQLQQSQPYDPSQTQSYEYDPSTQSYYYPTSQSYPQPYQNPTNPTSQSYPQHPQYPQQQQQQHQQQQYPSYYPPDYGVPGVYQGALQNDPNGAQLAAGNVGVPQEAPQIAADGFGAVGQPQQNAYYPPEQPQQQQRQRQLPQQATGYDVPPGLNPAAAAAVAALSQLTQFAGKMDAAERAMAERQWQARNAGFGQMVGMHPHSQLHPPGNFGPPIGRPPYRGGGRRGGGGQFRGGRSNFGHQRPRPVGGAPPSRARGHMGRGGGRRFPQRAPASVSLPHLESSSDLEPSSSPSPAPEQKRRAPQVAWCDLCRVDCNTQEVLEQHINGKRHKKNMEKFEKFQKYGKIQSESLPKLAEQLENGQGGEENKDFAPESLPDASATENLPDASAPENLPKSSSAENLPSATAADENMGVEQQIQIGEQSEIPKLDEPTDTPARKPWGHRFEDRRRAPKWKQMKFGRGGKRPRYSEVVSSSQTLREEPKYCALCNVTCDTQAVFECHLSGKKHMTLVKETQGQHDSYVHQGVHAPHPSLAHQIDLNPQGENQPPNGQTQQAVTESQDQQDPGLQGQINTAEPKVPEAVVVETRDTGVVVMEIEGRGTTLENASMGAESELITAEDVSAPNFGVSSTNVIMPGLDVEVDEGSKSTE